jgi:hypothetical protein
LNWIAAIVLLLIIIAFVVSNKALVTRIGIYLVPGIVVFLVLLCSLPKPSWLAKSSVWLLF